MITIQLTNEEAELFKLFREHQDLFKSLVDAGLLDTANGKLILNYNYMGKICDIEKHVHIKIA